MKIAIMSDLHLEFYKDLGTSFIKSLDSTDVDVLILAGDIITTTNYFVMLETLKDFRIKYPNIIYIPGNHEYYENNAYVKENQLARLGTEIPNLYIMSGYNSVEIKGQRFVGGTMWFRKDPNTIKYQKYMGDFSYIKQFVPWVYSKNEKFLDSIEKDLKAEDIVITHHLPSSLSVAKQFEGSVLNPFFLCDVETLIAEKQPRLWVHGHTHIPCKYTIGKTQIICNPRGYPNCGEGKGFDPNLKIDI